MEVAAVVVVRVAVVVIVAGCVGWLAAMGEVSMVGKVAKAVPAGAIRGRPAQMRGWLLEQRRVTRREMGDG